jgi:dihydrofolate reductase
MDNTQQGAPAQEDGRQARHTETSGAMLKSVCAHYFIQP